MCSSKFDKLWKKTWCTKSSHHIAMQSFGSIPIANMNKIFKLRAKKLSKDQGDGWKDLKQLEKNNVSCPCLEL